MRFVNYKAAAALCAATAVLPSRSRAQSTTSGPSPVTFSGEVRQRSDWDRPSDASADFATYLRARLGLRATPAAGLSSRGRCSLSSVGH